MNRANLKDDNVNKVTTKQKVLISVVSALLFYIVSSPFLYKVVRSLFNMFGLGGAIASESGCPTMFGLAVHTVVFGLLSFILMLF